MGGALGWTPQTFWKSTYSELFWFFRGWQKSQGNDPDEKPFCDREELDRLIEWDEKKQEALSHD